MRYFEYVREAFESLLRNRTRSILTLLGMVIGVAAVDAVYGLSVGAAQGINSSIASGDNPNLTIYPDPKQANPAEAALSYRDAARAADAAGSTAKRVTPFFSAFAGAVPRRSDARFGNAKVAALGFSWLGDDPKMVVVAGSQFSSEEVDSAARVVMLSQDLATHLFGSAQAAIGQTMTLDGARFRVTGVPDGSTGTAANYFGGSYYFVLPYSTFHDFAPGSIDGLYVWASSPDQEDAAKAAILSSLHNAHGAHAAYTVDSTRAQLDQAQKVLDVIAIGLTSIGGISLLVAGIGIMNIMLVAVTERTREIGIRKSIGAKSNEIVTQFLVEATLLSVLGGTTGLVLAIGVIALAQAPLASKLGTVSIPWATVVLYAFLFSLGIGLTFGVYPAARASRLDPVEALRT